jgi:site-specific recombinase XerD
LKKRPRDSHYLAYFRGSDHRRKEKSTKEANKRRATDAAITLINEEYAPKPIKPNPSWDEAVKMMVRYMKADNLRPGTIGQYQYAANGLRKVFQETHGPASITPALAQTYKVLRLEAKIAPRTVEGNLRNLSIVYGHWWRDTCKILAENPFANVEPPRHEKRPPRVIEPDELQQFVAWLSSKWDEWRLPELFLEIKNLTGCRIGELAKTPTTNLKDGRLCFEATTTKGRKQRAVKLPHTIYDELRSLVGKNYVFEAFSEQLRAIHLRRGRKHYAAMVGDFRPERLINWLEDQTTEYFRLNPKAKKFRLHNFRGTAMSRARMAGVSYDDAAVAFGCNPQTMREHYVALDELTISDRVMDSIQNGNGSEMREK